MGLLDGHFYNCRPAGCGWSGDALVYAGVNDTGPAAATSRALAIERNVWRWLSLRHPRGQGCCPNCGRAFAGAVHPNEWGRWVENKAAHAAQPMRAVERAVSGERTLRP